MDVFNALKSVWYFDLLHMQALLHASFNIGIVLEERHRMRSDRQDELEYTEEIETLWILEKSVSSHHRSLCWRNAGSGSYRELL